jgi:hypothetical protein
MLLDKISKHDPGMVIHGYNWTNGITVDQARAFCKDSLKFGDKADDLVIKSVTRIIVLVMLGSAKERNDCLRQSFNLEKGISLKKYMPKRFETMYRKFEDKAFKLRANLNVNTWTGFEGYKLVLKQKEKDGSDGQKYDWVIFDEYSPKPSDTPVVNRGEAKKNNGRASTIIKKDVFDSMAFLSGFPDTIKEEEVVEKVKTSFIGKDDLESVKNVTANKKGSVILSFSDSKQATAFVEKYMNTEFLGKKIRLIVG